MKTTRHQSRLQAVQVLYLMRERQTGAEDALEQFSTMGHQTSELAEMLVRGVESRLEKIDAKIQAASPNWRLDRIAWVDLAILRMAALELLTGQVPRAVVIDEAIEVAKTLGTEHSSAFVNGVLDHLRGPGFE